jgi:F0F1-type ATP synthase assembly protein I
MPQVWLLTGSLFIFAAWLMVGQVGQRERRLWLVGESIKVYFMMMLVVLWLGARGWLA